ncbi:flagellar basal body-associated FliL family protein [Guyparkeria sp. 1SP6A2]|nr:flagellar basal body-associated FliL family protein [Guyparkeria sp. 1SP6A2]
MAEAEGEETTPEKKGGSKLIVILLSVLIVVILLIAAVVTTVLLTGDDKAANDEQATEEQVKEEKKEAPKGPPITVSLGEPITVNLSKPNDANVLQVKLDMVTRHPEVEKMIQAQRSRIINDVMLVLSEVDAAELRSRAGKEALQQTLTDELNRILAEGGDLEEPVENVYFTKLLMQ